MKADYIVLRAKQPDTRDLFTGAAGNWGNTYVNARAISFDSAFTPRVANIMGAAGGVAGAQGDSVPGILPMPVFDTMSLPTLMPFQSSATTPELAVEIRSLERSSIADMSNRADVVAIAPSVPITLLKEMHDLSSAPSVMLAAQQVAWGIQAVGADTSPFTGKGIVVAVLDSGIASNHPAFAGIDIVEQDFTGEGNGDLIGHGTHCAGTIFGRNGKMGRIGVAPGIQKALIGKIIDKDGGGSSAMLIKAIEWAVDNGANVVSMSVGFDFATLDQRMKNSFPPKFAIARALEAYRATVNLFEKTTALIRIRNTLAHTATIFVGAAGNDSERFINPDFEVSVNPPANSEGFIAVGAVGIAPGLPGKVTVADFSNTGPNVCAPGIDIVSARPSGDLVAMNGTSMATPHVAGIAALWAEKLKAESKLSADLLTAKLIASASLDAFPINVDKSDAGAGLVRAPQT